MFRFGDSIIDQVDHETCRNERQRQNNEDGHEKIHHTLSPMKFNKAHWIDCINSSGLLLEYNII